MSKESQGWLRNSSGNKDQVRFLSQCQVPRPRRLRPSVQFPNVRTSVWSQFPLNKRGLLHTIPLHLKTMTDWFLAPGCQTVLPNHDRHASDAFSFPSTSNNLESLYTLKRQAFGSVKHVSYTVSYDSRIGAQQGGGAELRKVSTF